MRSRLVVALTLLVIGATTAGTLAATGGGTSAQLNASVTQYNSACAGPGGVQGSDCSGNNLSACGNNCNGNNNSACQYNCFGNNNASCTSYCSGNNNPQCTNHCWGKMNPKCTSACNVGPAPKPPPNCKSGQSPSGGGQPGPPYPSCYEVAGAPSAAATTALTAAARIPAKRAVRAAARPTIVSTA